MSANQDFAAMKKLLASWNVETLYDLLMEEDISIEDLKIIKFNHMEYLLRNSKMGVKIRFEHHLEKWRKKIGKPMNADEHNPIICSCRCKAPLETGQIPESNYSNKTINYNNPIPKELPTDHLELEYAEESVSSPQSTKSGSLYRGELTVTELPNLTPVPALRSSARQKRKKEDEDEEEGETEILTTLTDLLTTSLGEPSPDEGSPMFPSKPYHDKCPVTLSQILKLSGSRGMAPIKYYDENKRLTNSHRSQLIQTIVDFFVDNDYHLSLNMSHNLEWQILKMFPSEALEYYRTEKRGKIYVKFSNMKRYKRDRNNKVKTETEMYRNLRNNRDGLIITDSMTDNNMDTTSHDTWPEGAAAEIEIKSEQISEEP